MKNHYQTLGLQDGASQEAIQEAYDRLYKELDPLNNNNQEFFIEEFGKLQEAYKVLRNSSILAVTSLTTEDSTTAKSSPVSKKPNKKLELQKAPSQSKVKNTKIILVASAVIISGLIAYILFQPKQYELSQITLINDAAYSAFTRADMKPCTGNVKGIGSFINGLAEGEHNKLDKKGNSISEGQYKNGKKVGVWKEWYPIKDGKWHFWYEKGILKKECNYKNGLLVGDYSSWYINGQLEKKGDFKNGFAKGDWYYYDLGGKILANFNLDETFWAKNNLDVTRYRNGDLIPEVKDREEWKNLTTGAWCYYNNDPRNVKLYNLYAVNDPRGLAPEGFHIPSTIEIEFLQSLVAYGHRVSKIWNSFPFLSYEGRQIYGRNFHKLKLNPIPTGYSEPVSFSDSWFISKDFYHIWCSSLDSFHEYFLVLNFNLEKCSIYFSTLRRGSGYPVRCLRN